MIRKPAFEGRFYGSDRLSVFRLIGEMEKENRYETPEIPAGRIIGGVVPHAGHVYSGFQTVPFFRHLLGQGEIPDTFVIINPNHTGSGAEVALDPHDAWKNAIGKVKVDTELGDTLPYPSDATAQQDEHSAEVIVPYLQYYFRDHNFKILPVCMKNQTYLAANKLAKALHKSIRMLDRNVVIIASSDFSHFLQEEEGYEKDQMVLDMIEKKDADGLDKVVQQNNISICGYGPVMTLMEYSRIMQQDYTTKILARGHSGEVHPSREVVDYISILFSHNK